MAGVSYAVCLVPRLVVTFGTREKQLASVCIARILVEEGAWPYFCGIVQAFWGGSRCHFSI